MVDSNISCYHFCMAEQTVDSPNPVQGKKRHGCLKGCLKGCLGVVVLFVAIIVYGVFTTGDWRSDKTVLKNYQPSPVIADIALKDTLTDRGKALLYRTDPQFVNVEKFREICVADGIEGLACTDTRKTTFLLIDDPEFVDHKYSAAAHEMMHVAYSKLKTDEKTRVNVLLDQELTRHQDDPHLTGIIEMLKEKKAGDTDYMFSELHSKFAVEYTDLVPELEDYYRAYFTDRAQVVRLYQDGGFFKRVRRIDQLNQEATVLEKKLTASESKLRALQAAGVTNEGVDSYNALVNQHNSLVRQYNAKATESKRIFSEIESFYRLFNPNYKSPEPKAEQ